MNGIVIKGAIDRLDSDGVIGWLYGSKYATPPMVRAYINHNVIGEAVADAYRPDLEQVGFGDGRCGFEIQFNRPIDSTHLPFITVKPQDIDLHLSVAGTNTAYLDLVNTLIRGYTGTGRNRSVLGGFWTDRVDAAQVLAGRIAVGACAAELQPALQELILNGYVVLRDALVPQGISAKDAAAMKVIASTRVLDGEEDSKLKAALSAVSALLFREPVVRLLRAVMDDHPVVYRSEQLSGNHAFSQVCAFEPFPSPAECLALYLAHPTAPVQIDVVRDSHELPEFSQTGHSRWTPEGGDDIAQFAVSAGLSIQSIELSALDVAIIGPGLMHRVSASRDAPAFRAVVAPRRVTPTRFLTGSASWTEVGHISGGRIRV
jgi:hypothetical protein